MTIGLAASLAIGMTPGTVLAQADLQKVAFQTVALPPIVHLVEPGDTLWMISERYYGRALQWPDISFDNRIAEPRHLQPGTLLLLRAGDDSASVLAVTGDVRLMTSASVAVKPAALPVSRLLSTRLSEDGLPSMTAGALINKGDKVLLGSTLKTGPDSFITLLMPNGSRATLPSKSQVKLISFRDAKGQPAVLLDLNAGQVDARVQHSDDASGKSSYRIRTRLATIGARGTYFRVLLPDPDVQRALVGVLEGTVAANWGAEGSMNDQSHIGKPSAALLPAGHGSALQRGTAPRPAIVQKLLDAPILQDASTPQNQEDVLVRWLPVIGAAGYRVQMARDADFIDLLAQQDIATQSDIQNLQTEGAQRDTEGYKTWFSKLDKGSYFVRISAIAADGLEGLFALAGFSRMSYEVSGTVALTGNSAQLEFSWTPLPSSNYLLELAEDKEFANVVLSLPNLLSSNVRIAALPPGQYFWRVHANVQEHGQTKTVVSKVMPMLVGGVR